MMKEMITRIRTTKKWGSLPLYLTTQEVHELLHAASKGCVRDYAMLTTIYEYGLRVSELRLLTWCDLYLGDEPEIRVRRVKRGIPGTYPLTRGLRLAYAAWKKEVRRKGRYGPDLPVFPGKSYGKAISDDLIEIIHRKYATRIGLPEQKRHPHCLRHSIAVHSLEAGDDVADVQDLLGHANISSTMIYTFVSSRRRRRNFERRQASPEVATVDPPVEGTPMETPRKIPERKKREKWATRPGWTPPPDSPFAQV